MGRCIATTLMTALLAVATAGCAAPAASPSPASPSGSTATRSSSAAPNGTATLSPSLVATSATASPTPAVPSGSPATACNADAGAPAGPSQTEAVITKYAAAVKANPDDRNSLLYLGLAWYQHARETADPTDYNKAQQAFDRLLTANPDDVEALLGQATLQLSRHQFADALATGERVKALDPHISRVYGVIGDANNELGNDAAANDAIQTMVYIKPDLASYSRVSYARELHGDLDGAISVMEQAIRAGGAAIENSAYLRVVLGNLWFLKGNLDKADGAYRTTLALSPGYVFALAGVARVAAARGDLQLAIACYQVAANRVPFPEFVIALGEAQEAAGDLGAAQSTYALARQIEALFNANGVNTDLDLALFESDHGDPATALSLARTAYAATPNVKVADALAWALYQNGSFDEARTHAEEALRLGSLEPSYAYHAGMIAKAQGDEAAARKWLGQSIAANAGWSPLYAPRAAAALAEISK